MTEKSIAATTTIVPTISTGTLQPLAITTFWLMDENEWQNFDPRSQRPHREDDRRTMVDGEEMFYYIPSEELGLTADEMISYITQAFALEAQACQAADSKYERGTAQWEDEYIACAHKIEDRTAVDPVIVLELLEPLGFEMPTTGWTCGFGLDPSILSELAMPENWHEVSPIDYRLA